MDSGISISVDVAMIMMAVAAIITAIPPVFAVITAHRLQQAKLDAVHTLVNDQMTLEKAARLDDLRTQKAVLERVLGEDMTEADREMLRQMGHRIRQLSREVEKRDLTAERVAFPGGG